MCKYCHRSIFYQIVFYVTVRWLKYRIPTIFYSHYRNTVQENIEYRHIVRPHFIPECFRYFDLKLTKHNIRILSFIHIMLHFSSSHAVLGKNSTYKTIFNWWGKCDFYSRNYLKSRNNFIAFLEEFWQTRVKNLRKGKGGWLSQKKKIPFHGLDR